MCVHACDVIVAFSFNSISLLNIAVVLIFSSIAYELVYKSVQTHTASIGLTSLAAAIVVADAFFSHSIDSNQNM